MKRLVVSLVMCFGVMFCKGQNARIDSIRTARMESNDRDYRNNRVFVELFGSSFPLAINVERRIPFSNKPINSGITGSIGYAYRPNFLDADRFGNNHINLQLQYTREYTKRRIGVGLASIWFVERDRGLESVWLILVKHIWSFKRNKKLNWGLAFTPVIRDRGEAGFAPFGSLSIGMKLGKFK